MAHVPEVKLSTATQHSDALLDLQNQGRVLSAFLALHTYRCAAAEHKIKNKIGIEYGEPKIYGGE